MEPFSILGAKQEFLYHHYSAFALEFLANAVRWKKMKCVNILGEMSVFMDHIILYLENSRESSKRNTWICNRIWETG